MSFLICHAFTFQPPSYCSWSCRDLRSSGRVASICRVMRPQGCLWRQARTDDGRMRLRHSKRLLCSQAEWRMCRKSQKLLRSQLIQTSQARQSITEACIVAGPALPPHPRPTASKTQQPSIKRHSPGAQPVIEQKRGKALQ